MRRWFGTLPLCGVLLAGIAAAGCPNEAIGPGPRTADRRRAADRRVTSADAAAAKRALETICDRMEDCAIERNVSLAKAFGGTRADLESARLQARIALHSGYVRKWCQLRLGPLKRPHLMRIHKCLARTACAPFYQCTARSRAAQPGARLPK